MLVVEWLAGWHVWGGGDDWAAMLRQAQQGTVSRGGGVESGLGGYN